jgi:hypothetical protein
MVRSINILAIIVLPLILVCCSASLGSEIVLPQPLAELKHPISIETILAAAPAVVVPTSVPSSTPPPTFTATPSPEPSHTPTVTPTPSATPTPSPEPTITPSTATLAIPRLDLNPDQPLPYLETFRLLTYYGSPTGWGLGILGESAREFMTRDLRVQALELQACSPDRFVLPTYHMVTTVADDFPGTDENYNHHVKEEMIQEWIDAAKENQVAVIIDIQPGRAEIQDEFVRIRHFLYEPHVHLALDPEFIVSDSQIPGAHIGKIEPEQINLIQAQLNEIALEIGINRVLIIHQFKDDMVPDKDQLKSFAHVELVIDADGVGGRYSKLADYKQYVLEPGFEYAGIKIFPRHDSGTLLTIQEVMELEPPPAVVIYQ